MIRELLRHKGRLIITITLAAAIIALGWTRFNAVNIGTSVGSTTGRIVGKAVGSAKGITEGRKNGEEDGRDVGLSAESTTVQIKKLMTSVGNLQVLSAGVTVTNFHELGEAYKELSLVKGDVTFSVDLTDIVVSFNEDKTKAYIYVNEPTSEVHLDWGGTEILAKVQNVSLGVTAKDGMEACLNSMSQVSEKTEDQIENYTELKEAAERSAEKQIETLVKSINQECEEVVVAFRPKGNMK